MDMPSEESSMLRRSLARMLGRAFARNEIKNEQTDDQLLDDVALFFNGDVNVKKISKEQRKKLLTAYVADIRNKIKSEIKFDIPRSI